MWPAFPHAWSCWEESLRTRGASLYGPCPWGIRSGWVLLSLGSISVGARCLSWRWVWRTPLTALSTGVVPAVRGAWWPYACTWTQD